MSKPEISLQPTESTVTQAAVQLYAAYIISGQVKDGQEKEWMQRALKEAVLFARTAEGMAASDSERQPHESLPQTGKNEARQAVVEPGSDTKPIPLKEGMEDRSREQQEPSKIEKKMSKPADQNGASGMDEAEIAELLKEEDAPNKDSEDQNQHS
jgi:hypothetical protein